MAFHAIKPPGSWFPNLREAETVAGVVFACFCEARMKML